MKMSQTNRVLFWFARNDHCRLLVNQNYHGRVATITGATVAPAFSESFPQNGRMVEELHTSPKTDF